MEAPVYKAIRHYLTVFQRSGSIPVRYTHVLYTVPLIVPGLPAVPVLLTGTGKYFRT
jgi:hypothetical protein